MIVGAEHGILQVSGLALIANLAGLTVVTLSLVGVGRARRQKAMTIALTFALIGIALVICGTTVVIACE